MKCPGGIKATKFIMPENVVYVAYSAFKDCANINSIVISQEEIMVPDILKILINNTGTDLKEDTQKEDTQKDDGEDKQADKTTLNMTVAEIVKVYKANTANTVSDAKQQVNSESAVDTSKVSDTFDGSSAVSLMSLLTLSGAAIVTSKKIRNNIVLSRK